MEESKSELIAEIAELKLQLLSHSRLFALTAEEVEVVENALKSLKLILVNTYCSVPEIEPSLRESRIKVDNLLTRIKQWQDETKSK